MSSESPQQEVTPAIKPSKSRIWLRRAFMLLLFVIVIMGARAWQQRNIVKGPAAPLSGLLMDGKHYVLPAKPAQPVLVHFWATWCPVCRAEQGTIASLARDNQNVITVAIWSKSDSEVQQYMREQAINFPVINDTDNLIGAKWGVGAVPASFIIGTDGRIRFVEFGYTTETGLRLRLWLAGLLT